MLISKFRLMTNVLVCLMTASLPASECDRNPPGVWAAWRIAAPMAVIALSASVLLSSEYLFLFSYYPCYDQKAKLQNRQNSKFPRLDVEVKRRIHIIRPALGEVGRSPRIAICLLSPSLFTPPDGYTVDSQIMTVTNHFTPRPPNWSLSKATTNLKYFQLSRKAHLLTQYAHSCRGLDL